MVASQEDVLAGVRYDITLPGNLIPRARTGDETYPAMPIRQNGRGSGVRDHGLSVPSGALYRLSYTPKIKRPRFLFRDPGPVCVISLTMLYASGIGSLASLRGCVPSTIVIAAGRMVPKWNACFIGQVQNGMGGISLSREKFGRGDGIRARKITGFGVQR